MDDREQQRKVKHRLGVIRHAQEVTGNVAATCRYYGISRQCFYKWLRRYEELGEEGLRDGSSAPLNCPNATKPEVVTRIVYLRSHYHFGPHKIAMYLERYHDIKVSPSGIWRILNKLGMSRLPASQRYKRHKDRYKRYEKQLPGQRVQVDVKFIQPIGSPTAQEALPVHCHRRLHQDPGAPRLSRAATRKPPFSSSTTCSNGSPSRSRSSRLTMVPSSKDPSTGTFSTAASATSTSARPRLV